MTLYQFLLILKARWKVIAATFFFVIAVTVGLSLALPKVYKADTDVIIDVKSPDPVAGMILPALVMPGYMATQVDIINSDRVAQRVVDALKFESDEEFKTDWQDDTGGQGSLKVWIAEKLKKKLDVKPARESNVINISFKSNDAARAAAVANAFAQAYLETSIELKAAPAKQYAKWFQDQADQARVALEEAQAKLSKYQRDNGIIMTDERLDVELNKLNELSSQLSLVQGQSADAASKQKAIESAETLPEVIQNPLIQSLKSEISKLEAQLQESGRNFGKNHPIYLQQQAQVNAVKEKLVSETHRIAESIATSSLVAKGKGEELRSALEMQKQKILELKAQKDNLSVLARQVDAAQKAYDGISQRVSQANLESQTTQTNAAVLAIAVEPIKPSFPKLGINLIAAFFVGGLLSIGMALIREVIDPRIRSAENLKTHLGVPVLAEIQKIEKGDINIRTSANNKQKNSGANSRESIKKSDIRVSAHADSSK